jgi:radical SAM protein with 4Fe4S-binding SPASM domain
MRFKYVFIEICSVCNLACNFCPQTARQPRFMEPELFACLRDQLAPLTEQLYLHVMGEPLLHPQFPALVACCTGHGMPVVITTNGTLLDTPAAACLLTPTVRQVNISLQALTDPLNGDDATRRTWLDGVLHFLSIAQAQRPELYVNLRLWTQAERMAPVAAATDAAVVQRVEQALGVTIPPLAATGRHKSRRLTGRIYLHRDTRFTWPGTDAAAGGTALPSRRLHGTCHGLQQQLGILTDGTVVPCCLDHAGVIALGNCREHPLTEILADTRATTMLAALQRGELQEPLCQHCQFSRRFSS